MVFEKYMVFENITINDIIKSIFLMLLAISGGYVAQTLGCKTQKLNGDALKTVVPAAVLHQMRG